MTGHVRRRGERSWELKFDVGVDGKGQRKTRYASFRGTKRDAEIELAKLIAAADAGTLALQLPFLTISESMGNHDSKIVDADSVD
jgi:hypothetical protein